MDRKQSIEAAIAELLYQHPLVIIPQLGGFEKEYRPASFDYVQGKISPPSSSLVFNENLIVDDGLLLGHYKEVNEITLAEARQDVSDFGKKAKLTLFNKEVVSIPKVGRLLKDYENKTRFISENHNFNTDAFGLAELRYYPILRKIPEAEKEKAPHPSPKAAPNTTTQTHHPRRSQRWARVAIPIFILLVVVSAALLWFSPPQHDDGITDNTSTVEKEEPAKITVNISPPKKEDLDTNISTIDDMSMIEEDTYMEEEYEDDPILDDNDTEEATPITTTEGESTTVGEKDAADTYPKTNYTIYVGVYRYQKGVDAMEAAIVSNGWIPVVRTLANGNRKVGVEVPNDENRQALLKEVQAKIEEDAFLSRNKK